MLNALQFEERSLAKDIIESRRMNVQTRSVWRRAPSLNLKAVLENILAEAKQSNITPRRINLFCDTLMIDPATSIDWKNDSGLRVQIYARLVVASSTPALSMVLNESASLSLLATEVPADFQVSFATGPADNRTNVLFVPKDSFGIQAQAKNGQIMTSMLSGPDVDMIENIDYLKQLKDDGSLDSDKWIDDNLPRLLQFQFLVATIQVDRNPRLALRLLNYLCTASNTPASRDFNIQVTALRSSIVARQGTDISLVPSVNVFDSKNILEARLTAASSFEASFQSFITQERSSKDLTLFAANAIVSNQNALTEYAFLEGNARQAYAAAIKSYEVANSNYSTKQSELDGAAKRFANGVKAWKLKQELEAAKAIILGIVEVVGAIAATVATAGAAAPVAGIAIANAASQGVKVVGLIGKIKEIVVKIKEIYEKFKPLLEKIQTLVAAIKKMVDIVSQAAKISKMPNQLSPADPDSDPINGKALWEAFTIDVTMMFKELEDYPIDGKPEYQALLLKLPVFANALITAQVAVVSSGQNLTGILLRKKLDTDYQGRIIATLDHIQNDNAVLDILKRAMFDRVLAVRNLVYLDFWSYRAAFQFYSLKPASEVGIYTSAVQRISDYQADAARLQAAVHAFGATVRIQQKNFVHLVPLEQEHRDSLRSSGSLTFQPTIDHPAFEGFCRIRMSRARVFLQSANPTTASPTTVRLQLKTTGRFYDRDFSQSETGYSDVLAQNLVPRAFIGEPRMILFEYAANDQILCDGWFGLQNDFTKQTPFQEWTLQAKPVAGSTVVDWASVTAVRWEFFCEACAM
ncbi:hypothetical protein MMC27_008423 [Xylographa pallens]|nr:hypothetical protein [Xylographa pallens]